MHLNCNELCQRNLRRETQSGNMTNLDEDAAKQRRFEASEALIAWLGSDREYLSAAKFEHDGNEESNRHSLNCKTRQEHVGSNVCCRSHPITSGTDRGTRNLDEDGNDVARYKDWCDPPSRDKKDVYFALAAALSADDSRNHQVVPSCYEQGSEHNERLGSGKECLTCKSADLNSLPTT